MRPQAAAVRARALMRTVGALVATERDLRATAHSPARDLAVFHEFVPPPTGGGHQFLRALCGELERRGLELELNTLAHGTRACLFNSFNFDFRRLRRFARRETRMVHRVDGPIGVYRGRDDGTDARIARLNSGLADATVMQSNWSLERHLELGLELRDPTVIPNAADPVFFHLPAEREPLAGRALRVVVSSWSDNPRKGLDALQWLDAHLDTEQFEVTVVGRVATPLRRIRCLPPLPSAELADELRRHDAYLAPSRDDPCSNALIEALSCGLPAVYRRSGGHPELVGQAGIGFDDVEELGTALAALRDGIEKFRAAIAVPTLSAVADRYLEVFYP